MAIIRKDYLLDRYVYYATKRGKRPHEFSKHTFLKYPKTDLFAAGNEALTPIELGRVEYKGSWRMRWIPNKFPCVEPKGIPGFNGNQYFKQSKGYGFHELIIETRNQKQKLADLSVGEIALLLKIYAERVKHLHENKHIKYVQVFKNHGGSAGTSIIHEHSQVVAMPHIPYTVQEKLDALKKSKTDPFKTILAKESKSARRIKTSEHFVSFCPFASRFNYEAWIYPKKQVYDLESLDERELRDCAAHLKHIMTKLNAMGASYNYAIHYSPTGKHMRMHIEIMPRIATWAGFELGSGDIINSVLPEDAAAYYRKK